MEKRGEKMRRGDEEFGGNLVFVMGGVASCRVPVQREYRGRVAVGGEPQAR